MQREDRLDDWIDELDGLDATIATSAVDSEAGIAEAGAERPPDVEVRRLTDERDTLARRTEMERNTIRHALGHDDKPASHSYLYDEWDCTRTAICAAGVGCTNAAPNRVKRPP